MNRRNIMIALMAISVTIPSLLYGAYEFGPEITTTVSTEIEDQELLMAPDFVIFTEQDAELDISKTDTTYNYLTKVIDGYPEIHYEKYEIKEYEDHVTGRYVHKVTLTDKPVPVGTMASEYLDLIKTVAIIIADEPDLTHERLLTETHREIPIQIGEIDALKEVTLGDDGTPYFAIEYVHDGKYVAINGGELTEEQVKKMALAISAKP